MLHADRKASVNQTCQQPVFLPIGACIRIWCTACAVEWRSQMFVYRPFCFSVSPVAHSTKGLFTGYTRIFYKSKAEAIHAGIDCLLLITWISFCSLSVPVDNYVLVFRTFTFWLTFGVIICLYQRTCLGVSVKSVVYCRFNPFTTKVAKSGQPEMANFSESGQKQPWEKAAKKCAVYPR